MLTKDARKGDVEWQAEVTLPSFCILVRHGVNRTASPRLPRRDRERFPPFKLFFVVVVLWLLLSQSHKSNTQYRQMSLSKRFSLSSQICISESQDYILLTVHLFIPQFLHCSNVTQLTSCLCLRT